MKKQFYLFVSFLGLATIASAQTVSVDLTNRLLVNPDFEVVADENCNLSAVNPENVSSDPRASSYSGIPFGWNQEPTDFDSAGVRALLTAGRMHGSAAFEAAEPHFPAEFRLYQTIPASKLTPGTYKVTCLMYIEKDHYGTCGLFANKNISFFTNAGYYTDPQLEGWEDYTFANYAGGDTKVANLFPMEVYVTVNAGDSLQLGIFTNDLEKGSSVKYSGYFIVDNFRIERVLSVPEKNFAQSSIDLIENNSFELADDGSAFTGTGDWNMAGQNGLSENILGWGQNYITDNYGLSKGHVQNLEGKWAYWLSSKGTGESAVIPQDFKISQVISADNLVPGVYEVNCRMWQETGKQGMARLFATSGDSTSVTYYSTKDSYNANILNEEEHASFAGYSPSDTKIRRLNPMGADVTVQPGQDLEIGVKSGQVDESKVDDGSFFVDNFTIHRLSGVVNKLYAGQENNIVTDNEYAQCVQLDKRFTNKQWNTVCLPFALSKEDVALIFGEGSKVASLGGVDGDKLNFNTVEAIEAGKPYIVFPTDVLPSVITLDDVMITTSDATSSVVGDISFQGTFQPVEATAVGKVLVNSDEGFTTMPADATVEAFSAYITNSSASSMEILIDGQSTGINTVGASSTDVPVYNLAGQRVGESYRGVLIRNGKKEVRK